MQKQHLATVYQLIATIEKPARFKKLLKRSFGNSDVALVVQEYAKRSLIQSLSNAGIREGKDTESAFERVYSLLDRISEAAGIRINKVEKNKVISHIDPADYQKLLAVPQYLNRRNAPSELGSFQAGEMLSGILNFIICNQTMQDPSPRIAPVLNNLISKGASFWESSYPYDVTVHDVVALANRANQEATIYVANDYVSTTIDFNQSEWVKQHCASANKTLVFHV
jgi:hypothetical protein